MALRIALEQRPQGVMEHVTWPSGRFPPSTRNISAKSLVGTARPMGPRNSVEQEKLKLGEWREQSDGH